MNTTVGLFGVLDLARMLTAGETANEDIGQALVLGIGRGPYLVLPFLGRQLRDLGGYVGDRCANPFVEPFSVLDDWEWPPGLHCG